MQEVKSAQHQIDPERQRGKERELRFQGGLHVLLATIMAVSDEHAAPTILWACFVKGQALELVVYLTPRIWRDWSVDPVLPQPSCQPKAVASDLIGDCDTLDLLPLSGRLVMPAVQ